MKVRSVTLVYTNASVPQREWRLSMFSSGRLIATGSPFVLDYSITPRAMSLGLDVERIIIDRAMAPKAVREFVARIPPACRTEVLSIQQDGSALLSVDMCDFGRTTLHITADDVHCYLAAAGVIPPPGVPEPVRYTAVA